MEASTKTINVLLLGETGVGKSTFINAFLNYVTHSSLNEATKGNLLHLIPSKFSMLDDDLNERVIKIGSSSNELQQPGVSATQEPRTYLFELKEKNVNIRLIDTPGIGDTRGMQFDHRNTENLLTLIGELDYLNCICILLKPNDSRLSVLFDYCVNHILSRVDRKVRNNIAFVFTHSRSTFYAPGDTLQPLQAILNKVENRRSDAEIIPLDSSNIFCVDNESFRYLAAKSTGHTFTLEDVESYRGSWDKSVTTCKRFVSYVSSLNPIFMQGTVTINECRRVIGRLAKPAIELLVLHEKAVIALSRHENKLEKVQNNIDELRKLLYTPITAFSIGKKTIASQTKVTFNAGVSLSLLPPFFTVKLGYKYTSDQKTEDVVVNVQRMEENPLIKASLSDETKVQDVVDKQVEALTRLSDEYKREGRVILGAAAVFVRFLKENAILSGNDPFEFYLESIITEEEAADEDPSLITKLKELLIRYQVKRDYTYSVKPLDVQEQMKKVLELKHSGSSFKYFYDKKYVLQDKQYAIGSNQ